MGLCTPDKPPTPAKANQPKPNPDPYEVIKIPRLPDLSHMPTELQVFRDQCAAGVRQAVAMGTAMEHQLWWERSRRQQAEDDIQVLLAAVHAERNLAGGAVADMTEALRQAKAAVADDKLKIAAEELPKASAAATTIQKNFRGHAARKEFESRLVDVLRGIDPDLDPSTLPAVAQHHISNVNARGVPQRIDPQEALTGVSASGAPRIKGDAGSEALRKQVDMIERRRGAAPGGSYEGDPALDPNLDIKRILQGTLPASSAAVIAALVRRCKELQAALVEVAQLLQESRRAEEGLRAENAKVLDLSAVHIELEEERASKAALQQTLAKLRHVVSAQAAAAQNSTAGQNPHIAAWYRRQYAGGEFIQYPPKQPAEGLRDHGRRHVFDGPEAEVEFWDNMRPGLPDPILLPKEATQQYADLLALRDDMAAGARPAHPWEVDPLYTSAVPSTAEFQYARDTPIMPVGTTAGIVRDMPWPPPGPPAPIQLQGGSQGGAGYAAAPPPGQAVPQTPPGQGYGGGLAVQAPQQQQQQQQQQQPERALSPEGQQRLMGGAYVPMYSVLPLIQESRASPPTSSGGAYYPPPSPPHRHYAQQPQGQQQPGFQLPQAALLTAAYSDMLQPPTPPLHMGSPPSFNYMRDTPTLTLQSGQYSAVTPGQQQQQQYSVQPSGNSMRGQYTAMLASRGQPVPEPPSWLPPAPAGTPPQGAFAANPLHPPPPGTPLPVAPVASGPPQTPPRPSTPGGYSSGGAGGPYHPAGSPNVTPNSPPSFAFSAPPPGQQLPPTPGLKPLPPQPQHQMSQGGAGGDPSTAGYQYLSPLSLIREGGQPASPAPPPMPPTPYAGSRPPSPGPANVMPPPAQQQYQASANAAMQYPGAAPQTGMIPAGGQHMVQQQQQAPQQQQQGPMYTGVPGMQPAPFTGPQPYVRRFYNA